MSLQLEEDVPAMGAIDANACKPGTKLLLDGELYSVIERAHHKPGKGGAFVRFKLKGIVTGKVVDHTVRAGTKMDTADVSTETMQYLYQDGENYVFMDLETYDQIMISDDLLGFSARFLTENAEAEVTMYDGKAIGVQLPPKMVFEVVDTIENPAKGNTATNVLKDAQIATGMTIQVPPFIKIGDRVRVSTEDGSYVERVND
jgi:elongation factor P